MTQKLQFPDILCGFDSQLSVSQNIGMVWGGVVGGADRCRSESVVFRQGFRGRSMIGTSGMFITHMQICRDAIFGVLLSGIKKLAFFRIFWVLPFCQDRMSPAPQD